MNKAELLRAADEADTECKFVKQALLRLLAWIAGFTRQTSGDT